MSREGATGLSGRRAVYPLVLVGLLLDGELYCVMHEWGWGKGQGQGLCGFVVGWVSVCRTRVGRENVLS